jgi:hypothetical protein
MAFRAVIFSTLFFVITGLLVLTSLPRANVLVAANIASDTIETRIRNPSEAEFILPRALLLGSAKDQCLDKVVVRPDQDSLLVVTAETDGSVYIVIEGRSSWRTETVSGSSDDGSAYLISASNPDCSWKGRARLPMAGSLAAGLLTAGNQESGEGLLPLTQGELTIYGRATETILWFVPLALLEPILPIEPGRLYLADTFTIPSGSRLESLDARWWGYIEMNISNGAANLSLNASTNADNIGLFAPAPRTSREPGDGTAFEPDTVSLTFATRLGNDPNLRWLFGTFSILIVLIGLVAQAYSLRNK